MSAAEPSVRVDVIAYAPTEFFHCQHCEVVWHQVGLGQRVHAEQRASGLLPPDLEAEYAAISDWALGAAERYDRRLTIRVIDAASLEGVWRAVRHRLRRFPAFVVDGRERFVDFDPDRLDAALAARLGRKEATPTSP